MGMTRRDLAAAATLAFGAIGFAGTALAAGDDAEITANVEALRKAILAQDKAKLEALVTEQLSYGHSSAVVQSKAEFVNGVMTRKATLKTLEFPDVKVAVAGNAAIVRHNWMSESENNGKTDTIKLGVLAVWQKQGDSWKLLARQGYKLPS